MTLILVILFPILLIASLVAQILITPLHWLDALALPQWFYWGLVLGLLTWGLPDR